MAGFDRDPQIAGRWAQGCFLADVAAAGRLLFCVCGGPGVCEKGEVVPGSLIGSGVQHCYCEDLASVFRVKWLIERAWRTIRKMNRGMEILYHLPRLERFHVLRSLRILCTRSICCRDTSTSRFRRKSRHSPQPLPIPVEQKRRGHHHHRQEPQQTCRPTHAQHPIHPRRRQR